MKLFRDDLNNAVFSRFRAKQLLLEFVMGELNSERKNQVEYWIAHCRETQEDWQAMTKALTWCQEQSGQAVQEIVKAQSSLKRRKKISIKKLVALAFILFTIGGVGYWMEISGTGISQFQLLAIKENKTLPHVEALQIEVDSQDNAKIEELLNQFKKEGTEVKSLLVSKTNENIWTLFVMQSHVRQLIEQIKTLGLVRIPEGYSAEVVSDGQIQIILKSRHHEIEAQN